MTATGRKFNWIYLIVAVIALAAFAHANPRWGKWIFAIAIISALLIASNSIVDAVGGGSKVGV